MTWPHRDFWVWKGASRKTPRIQSEVRNRCSVGRLRQIMAQRGSPSCLRQKSPRLIVTKVQPWCCRKTRKIESSLKPDQPSSGMLVTRPSHPSIASLIERSLSCSSRTINVPHLTVQAVSRRLGWRYCVSATVLLLRPPV